MADKFLTVAIPLIAILFVGLFVYASSSSQHTAVQFTLRLAIRGVTRGGSVSQVLLPSNIGDPGGVNLSTRYLQDGVNGFYPVSTRDQRDTIYVESRVSRNYTLGDFFEVWGQPLGPANTLGRLENFTAPGLKDFFWGMCLIEPGSPTEFPSFEWGTHVLRAGEIIDLVYSPQGCG